MGWWNEWAEAGEKAKARAASETCDRCGGPKVLGYSNLGIPLTCCPTCSPSLVANGRRTVDEVFYADHA